MVINVTFNGTDQFRHASEDAPAQSLAGQVAEELLDHIQPQRRGRKDYFYIPTHIMAPAAAIIAPPIRNRTAAR